MIRPFRTPGAYLYTLPDGSKAHATFDPVALQSFCVINVFDRGCEGPHDKSQIVGEESDGAVWLEWLLGSMTSSKGENCSSKFGAVVCHKQKY